MKLRITKKAIKALHDKRQTPILHKVNVSHLAKAGREWTSKYL